MPKSRQHRDASLTHLPVCFDVSLRNFWSGPSGSGGRLPRHESSSGKPAGRGGSTAIGVNRSEKYDSAILIPGIPGWKTNNNTRHSGWCSLSLTRQNLRQPWKYSQILYSTTPRWHPSTLIVNPDFCRSYMLHFGWLKLHFWWVTRSFPCLSSTFEQIFLMTFSSRTSRFNRFSTFQPHLPGSRDVQVWQTFVSNASDWRRSKATWRSGLNPSGNFGCTTNMLLQHQQSPQVEPTIFEPQTRANKLQEMQVDTSRWISRVLDAGSPKPIPKSVGMETRTLTHIRKGASSSNEQNPNH